MSDPRPELSSGRAAGLRIACLTICAKNRLALARTLMGAVSRHCPGYERHLLLADRIDGTFDPAAEPMRVTEAGALGLPELKSLAFGRDARALTRTLTPYAIRHLFEWHGYDAVISLADEVLVLHPMEELDRLLHDGAPAVLTPRLNAPAPGSDGDGNLPTGTFDPGLIALTRTPQVMDALDWWCKGVARDQGPDAPAEERPWADTLPAFLDGLAVLRHPGYGVAWWNFESREISHGAVGSTAAGQPLVVVHFADIDVDAGRLTRSRPEIAGRRLGSMADLLERYLAQVRYNGWEATRALPYAYGSLPSGAPIPPILRRAYRAYAGAGHLDPFVAADEVLAAPEARLADGHPPVTRLMYWIWSERADLRRAFDLTSTRGRDGLGAWILRFGTDQLKLPPEVVEPIRRIYQRRTAGRSLTRWMTDGRGRRHLPRLGWVRRAFARARRWTINRHPGILLVGFGHAETGLGQAMRGHRSAIETAGLDFEVLSLPTGPMHRQAAKLPISDTTRRSARAMSATLLMANAPEIVYLQMTRLVPARSYTIGCWHWELAGFPPAWQAAFENVDEVWASSAFIHQAVAAASPKPVVRIPLAVQLPRASSDRGRFGIAEDRVVFLCAFDLNSFMARKNPAAAVEAFARAFPPNRRDVSLVLKSNGAAHNRFEAGTLEELIAADNRITHIGRVLDGDDYAALQASCDVFVSLHRSEGFGLNIAECMALGKAVVVTDYSGNRDYATAANACPIDYKLVPVEPESYPHWQGQHWAEPDLDHAAWHMRQLADDAALRARIGDRARTDIARDLSPKAVGARIRARLAMLGLLNGEG